jgi:predicted ATPase
MTLAFCGAHRTGKSTLANAICKRTGWAMVPSRAANAHEDLGFHVGDPLSFEERMAVQTLVLQYHVEDIGKVPQNSVSDRSTLDMATYALCEWGMSAVGSQADQLQAYVDRCFKLAVRSYTAIILIQPGIPYVEAEGKPPPSQTYQNLFNYVVRSMMLDRRLNIPCFIMPQHLTSLEDRMDGVSRMWAQMQTEAMKMMEGEPIH